MFWRARWCMMLWFTTSERKDGSPIRDNVGNNSHEHYRKLITLHPKTAGWWDRVADWNFCSGLSEHTPQCPFRISFLRGSRAYLYTYHLQLKIKRFGHRRQPIKWSLLFPPGIITFLYIWGFPSGLSIWTLPLKKTFDSQELHKDDGLQVTSLNSIVWIFLHQSSVYRTIMTRLLDLDGPPSVATGKGVYLTNAQHFLKKAGI